MHSLSKQQVLEKLSVDSKVGLRTEEIAPRRAKYGANKLERKKQKSLIMRVLEAFCDPMLIILCFALCVTLGVNIGKYVRMGDGDFIECIGIFAAVLISVTITVIMEGRSEKAFELLSGLSDKVVVKVRRDGEIRLVPQSEVVVGDIVILEGGSKVVADGRLIYSNELSADESMLTGESKRRKKLADAFVKPDATLSERQNCVYGGTLITSGYGEMVTTAVGDDAEMGKIAGELQNKDKMSSPLNEKLSRLGKLVTVIGGVAAAVVFVVSLIRLIVNGAATFDAVQELFIESVVLIVAAVPEGLPTIVAISLSLNVLKLAKENALIKKLVVAETAGCVSVICSDKTGTLTKNTMTVKTVCSGELCYSTRLPQIIRDNIIANSTAAAVTERGVCKLNGNPTECALISFVYGKNPSFLDVDRARFEVLSREEFSSEKKYMSTKTRINGSICEFYKGSFERISVLCKLSGAKLTALKNKVDGLAAEACRVIAFAHDSGEGMVFDGFVALSDPIREDVKESVAQCKRAGIAIKILTGDNAETAFAIAKQLGIASSRSQVVCATDADKLTDQALLRLLSSVTVIARSTPLVKLRVVKLLKEAGEVVAVTGDGINDAPAIKQADIGIAMGSGSEIAKEAGDIVLLDDSFTTIAKAISFGRNVYANFQRFIMFQLSVNFSAVITVLAFLLAGLKAPFNALQLLWLNVIMDGPPALTLGFEAPSHSLMTQPPKRRSDNLVTKKIAARIATHSLFISLAVILQRCFNFLAVPVEEQDSVIFTLFVFFQLFNAFNCRVVGSESIFKSFFANRSMLLSFGAVALVQIVLTQLGGSLFGSSPLSLLSWVKVIALSSTVLAVSELFKLIYRLFRRYSGKNIFVLKGERVQK